MWVVSEPPKRTFKPWQRLWVVTGLFYLVMLVGSCHLLLPDLEGVERRMIFSVTEEVLRYDGMAYA